MDDDEEHGLGGSVGARNVEDDGAHGQFRVEPERLSAFLCEHRVEFVRGGLSNGER